MNANSLKELYKVTSKLARDLRAIENKSFTPILATANLIPNDIVIGTRDYIVKITREINATYATACYTACFVLVRRLLETLIIECYERHGISHKIKDNSGNYKPLSDLITLFLNEPIWNIPRDVRRFLHEVKTHGDNAAHNRYFIAYREDIEKMRVPIRFCVQALIYIAGYK